MATMAQWLHKKFEVNSRRLTGLNEISASATLDTENNTDEAGTPATNVRGRKPETYSFSFDVAVVGGVDVRAEYEEWRSLLGWEAPFYLGGSRFGPERLQLTGVSLGNAIPSDHGKLLTGQITISLKENAEEAAEDKEGVGSTGAAGLSSGSAVSSAVSVGATSADKAAKG